MRVSTESGEKLSNTNDALNILRGHFDGVFGRVAVGWAYLETSLGNKVTVQFVDGDRVVAEAPADNFRDDLVEAGVGNGWHAFKCVLPIELFDGKQRKIYARVKGYSVPLDGSPRVLAQKLPSLHEAFNPIAMNAAPPMSDFQVAMLHGLTKVCETLSHQNEVLRSLGTTQRLESVTAASSSTNQATSYDVERYGPYLKDFLRSTPSIRDVIIFPIIDWDFRIQRPQHLAMNLAKMGCRVTYLSVHLDPREQTKEGFFIRGKPSANVFEVALRCSQPVPSMYAGLTSSEQIQELCAAVDKMMHVLGINAPAAILQYPTWLPIVNSIPGAHVIFDCLDHIAGFNTASPEVIELEKELISTADLVVTSSQYLHDAIAEVRPNPIIRNAAEVEYFATQPSKVCSFGSGPIIGYYGAIAEWFDVGLVATIAKKKPKWTFVLVGSTTGADITPLRSLPNVRLVGEVPYNQLTKYLYAFDCCIIPFKLIELIKATNPVKVYEYFAAGKPVVSTDMPELRRIPSELISISKSTSGFVKSIEQALVEGEEKKMLRRLWAFENSWARRARDYLLEIEKSCPKVSVVVLCYNGLELTKACLHSLEKHSHYPNLEIICVDNNSSDGTKAYLQEWSKGKENVKIVLNDSNLGFAWGNNVGVKHSEGDYVILLNNDTYVTNGWVQDLIRPLVQNHKIGLAGPITNMIGNEQKINIHYQDMADMADRARLFTQSRKRTLFYTDNLAFFCVAIPRRVINEVGLLDVQFGRGFFEDDDYCRRVSKAGYQLVVVDGVFIHHHLSGAFDKIPEEKKKLMMENKRKFESKWGTWKPHKYRDEAGFGA